FATLGEQRLDVPAPLLGVLEARVGRLAGGVPGLFVLAEPSRPLAHTTRPRVDLDDPRHGAVEELPVVRDDDEAAMAGAAGAPQAAQVRRSRGRGWARQGAARRPARGGSPPARRAPPRHRTATPAGGRARPAAPAPPLPGPHAPRDRRRRARRRGRARLRSAPRRRLPPPAPRPPSRAPAAPRPRRCAAPGTRGASRPSCDRAPAGGSRP